MGHQCGDRVVLERKRKIDDEILDHARLLNAA
jgi:hypothetical protein